MKVLHIGDKAAVACLLAKMHRENGGEAKVIKMDKYNPTLSADYYGEDVQDLPPKKFMQYCIDESEKYDICHVHGLDKIVPLLNKPVVFQHHGSDLFNNVGDFQMRLKLIDCPVIVSTEDMVSTAARYYGPTKKLHLILNAPDTELFNYDFDWELERQEVDQKALCITAPYIDREALDKYLEMIDPKIEVEVQDRGSEYIPYQDMPKVFDGFTLYVDIKPLKRNAGIDINIRSKTALEALSCGLGVVTSQGIISGLPFTRTPQYQYKQVKKIYDSLYSHST